MMNALVGRSAVPVAAVIASLLAGTPARAQSAPSAQGASNAQGAASARSDEGAILAVVTKFLNGIRTRDTSLMRSAVAAGATLVPVGGPAGLGAPLAIDAIIERTGKGTGPGTDERIDSPTVEIDDHLASLWAYFAVMRPVREPAEIRIDRCGVNAFLLRQGPDGWKIFQIAATSRTDGCRAIGR